MRISVTAENSIYAAIVTVDITGAVTYRTEDLPGLYDTYPLSPLPSELFGLRAYQRSCAGFLANSLTEI
jgi:hypothetical protein